jgi:hypothetical protein
MPKSKIQAEFLRLAKVDAEEYDSRQDYLKAVMDKVNTFKDPQWDKLTEDAQTWMNDAIKAFKGKKRLPDFPDVGSVPKDDDDDDKPAKKKKPADDDDGDDDDAPKKKKKPADEDDDDDQPKKRRRPADDDDDDDAPKGKKRADDDDDEEQPKKKKKAADDDDDDEKPAKKKKPAADDDDEDKPKKKKTEEAPPKSSGVKVAIKDAIIDDPDISVEAIVKKLGKGGADVSKVTVSNVRAEFRHSLKLLKERGKLKGIEL